MATFLAVVMVTRLAVSANRVGGQPERPTELEQPTEPDAPADPDRKIVGGDDTMTGGSGDDRFVPGVGNDTATGGADADEFIIDWRYRDAGDAHTLTDLDFEDGAGGTLGLTLNGFAEFQFV